MNEVIQSLEHKNCKFTTLKMAAGGYGYIDHNGILSISPGASNRKNGFPTEQHAIDDARAVIDMANRIVLR